MTAPKSKVSKDGGIKAPVDETTIVNDADILGEAPKADEAPVFIGMRVYIATASNRFAKEGKEMKLHSKVGDNLVKAGLCIVKE